MYDFRARRFSRTQAASMVQWSGRFYPKGALNFYLCKNYKNITFVTTRFVFFSSSKCTKTRFRPRPLGELTTLPHTP